MNTMTCRLAAILGVMALILSCSTVPAARGDASDAGKSKSLLLAFYQGPLNHLTAVRRGECPMYPSDSQYAKAAIEKHGPVLGWVMAFDRLMRCGRDEVKLAPAIIVDGKFRTYDPVSQNDFWWTAPDQTEETLP